MGRAFEQAHQLTEGDVALDCDDIAARHHDVGDAPLVQVENVAQHGALDRGETGLVGRGRVQYHLEIGARGVTANVVAPGVIEGSMANDAFPPESIKQIVPAGRAGKPEEVAALVGFLCSVQAGYITGQNILADGGAYPGVL